MLEPLASCLLGDVRVEDVHLFPCSIQPVIVEDGHLPLYLHVVERRVDPRDDVTHDLVLEEFV